MHKHNSSARLRFLKLDYGGVCGFSPMPTLAQLLDSHQENGIALHPAQLVQKATDYFGLSSGDIEVVSEYHEFVDVPEGPIQVFLARFTAIDPPFLAAKKRGAEFIELPQARNLPQVELELLREVYTLVIGG